MYYVYFTRSYNTQEQIAECRTFKAACARAVEEFDAGASSVAVLSDTGRLLYEPEEEYLIDEA